MEMEIISEKKEAIFESMLALIKDHGFHGAPMSMVAKNAGVAAGTIYHYFKSKDELIIQLHEYNRSRVVEVINAALAEEKSCKEKFFKLWTDLYAFYIKHPNVLIFFEQYINSPFSMHRCPNYFKGQLLDFFQAGIEAGKIKEAKPEMLLMLMMGNISSMAKMKVFGNIPFNETELKQIRGILWDGIKN